MLGERIRKSICAAWSRRRLLAGVAVLAIVGSALGYAWAVATPEIGEPFQPATAASGAPLWKFGFVGDTQQADDALEPLMAKFERQEVEFVVHLGTWSTSRYGDFLREVHDAMTD